MMNANKLSLNSTQPRALVLPRALVVAWADRLVAHWLRRSQARAAWRRCVPVLNSM